MRATGDATNTASFRQRVQSLSGAVWVASPVVRRCGRQNTQSVAVKKHGSKIVAESRTAFMGQAGVGRKRKPRVKAGSQKDRRANAEVALSPHHTLSPVTRISQGRFLPGDGNSRAAARAFYPPSDGIPPVAPRPDRLAYQLRQSGRPDSLDNSCNDTAKRLPTDRRVVIGPFHAPEGMEGQPQCLSRRLLEEIVAYRPC